MTKKDFTAIAREFQEIKYSVSTQEEMSLLRQLATNLSYYFKETNPRFNQYKFLNACGWYDWE